MRCILVAVLVALPAIALAAPRPPCGGIPDPAHGSTDGPPQAGIWTADELRASRWQSAACLGWNAEAKLVAAVASRFHTNANVFDRLGLISAWPGIKYWSISKQRWEPLVSAAFVVDGRGHRQADLSPADLVPGREHLFVERDANTGESTYRLRVLDRSADRIVVATENVTPIKIMIMTAFESGALQTVTFVQKEGPDLWSTYQITRVGIGANSMVLEHQGSFLNRLEAIRRHLAGQPSDQQPPLAPR